MIPKERWKWYGHPGHFIGGDSCRYHLCTKVGKWLVSTVGEYRPRYKTDTGNREFETIGLDRKYETMVFRAGKPCSSKDCGCGLPNIDGSELDMEGYNSAGEAADGHLRMCRKWARREGERSR